MPGLDDLDPQPFGDSCGPHFEERLREFEASLDLPLSCLERVERSHDRQLVIEVAAAPLAEQSEMRYLCCADCHRPKGGGPVSTRYTQAITTACNACHHSAVDIGPLGGIRLSLSRLWG